MRNKRNFIVLLIKWLPIFTLLGLSLPAKGDPATVSIKDAQTRLPIPFALVSNGGRVTLTDAMGLLASQGNSLSISAFGYQSQEVTLNGEDSLHVYLQPIAHRKSTTDDIHAREVAMTLGAKHTPPPPSQGRGPQPRGRLQTHKKTKVARVYPGIVALPAKRLVLRVLQRINYPAQQLFQRPSTR